MSTKSNDFKAGDKALLPEDLQGAYRENITREEAASMLARTAKVLDIPAGKGQSFGDEGDIASWAKEGAAFTSGLTDPATGDRVMGDTGDGKFFPLAFYTREQAYLTALRLFHCGQ